MSWIRHSAGLPVSPWYFRPFHSLVLLASDVSLDTDRLCQRPFGDTHCESQQRSWPAAEISQRTSFEPYCRAHRHVLDFAARALSPSQQAVLSHVAQQAAAELAHSTPLTAAAQGRMNALPSMVGRPTTSSVCPLRTQAGCWSY